MLNDTTKRKINSLRDILVGVVPGPEAQVNQITNALIYKYMDDMDQQAIVYGGKSSFFVKEYEKYSWKNLMDPKKGGQERMNLYVEALEKMGTNKNLSPIFRDILKSAFLPYRSPETLNLFLSEVDGFSYDHSEELGNAFEYLLAIMGSQGDAGMFRTPRHIIDFIVKVVDPKKDETVLDPACGTAGFLISAYKHIIGNHDGIDNETGKATSKEARLSADEIKKIHGNFCGYDINPDMTKFSRVNMFLHNFPDPKIFDYDTLSSDDRWDDNFDVILANPPFMTPKGGIIPHKRFSVPANRAEVLFVDYIMNHLKKNGRAGIIVPEGIVFKSETAYKQLRKNLVEDGLYAVVSLPGGVFNPYAGVKTCILFFDNQLSKKTKEVLFVKVSNDGYDLGAQRRKIEKDDLSKALEILNSWKKGKKIENTMAAYVEKSKIAERGDYNLSGDRYRVVTNYSNAKWPMVALGDEKYFSIESGGTPDSKNEKYWKGNVNWVTLVDLPATDLITEIRGTKRRITEIGLKNSSAKLLPINSILISSRATIGRIAVNSVELATNQGFKNIIIKDEEIVNYKYIALAMTEMIDEMKAMASGGTFAEISKSNFSKLKIPLPPLEIQKQIVAELDGYQKIITGAKQIVQNWKPKIDISPEWEKAKLKAVSDVRDGTHDSPKQVQDGYPLITSKNIKDSQLDFSNVSYISEEDFKKVSQRSYVDVGDIIMPMIGTIGGACLIKSKKIEFAIKNVALFKKSKKIVPEYLLNILDSDLVAAILENKSAGATQKFVSLGVLREIEIPLPSLEIQKQIVEKIEAERTLVESAKKLIEIYEQKTKDTIAKLWEE